MVDLNNPSQPPPSQGEGLYSLLSYNVRSVPSRLHALLLRGGLGWGAFAVKKKEDVYFSAKKLNV